MQMIGHYEGGTARVDSHTGGVRNVLYAGRHRRLDSGGMLTAAALAHVERTDEKHAFTAGESRSQRTPIVKVTIANLRATSRQVREGLRLACDENQFGRRCALEQQLRDHPAERARCPCNDGTHV